MLSIKHYPYINYLELIMNFESLYSIPLIAFPLKYCNSAYIEYLMIRSRVHSSGCIRELTTRRNGTFSVETSTTASDSWNIRSVIQYIAKTDIRKILQYFSKYCLVPHFRQFDISINRRDALHLSQSRWQHFGVKNYIRSCLCYWWAPKSYNMPYSKRATSGMIASIILN